MASADQVFLVILKRTEPEYHCLPIKEWASLSQVRVFLMASQVSSLAMLQIPWALELPLVLVWQEEQLG